VQRYKISTEKCTFVITLILNAMFVDIHTHNDLNKANVIAVRNLLFNDAGQFLESELKGIFSVGLHPWHAGNFSFEQTDLFKIYAADKRVLAIGECGFDKNASASIQIQAELFKQQIIISEEIQKPMIIHCVGCFNELLEIRKKTNPLQLWIIHGYRGKPQLAMQLLKAGISLSFGKMYNVESVNITPLNKLYIETDESNISIEDLYQEIALIKNCRITDLTAGYNLLHNFIEK